MDISFSNAEVLRIALLGIVVLILLLKQSDRLSSFYSTAVNFKLSIFFLVAIQAAVLFSLPAYRYIITTYTFTYIVGLSLFALIAPSFLRKELMHFVFIPLVGLMVISVVGAYFIRFDVRLTYLAPILLLTSLTVTGIQFSLYSKSIRDEWNSWIPGVRSKLAFHTLVITPIILLLVLPVLDMNPTTSPYRVGPDLATYAKMSQFYLDGGTWSTALQRSGEFDGMTIGEIIKYSDVTMSWPPRYYFRWGLTAYNVAVSTITFTDNAFQTIFVSIILPHLLLGGLIFIWLKEQFGLTSNESLAGFIALVFNANLINIWYEGFYGNAFALVFISTLLYVFTHFMTPGDSSKVDRRRSIAFLSLLFAACMASYAEAIFYVLSFFMVFIFLCDLFYKRLKIEWRPYLIFLTGGIIGLIIVLPCNFLIESFLLTLKQVTESGGNGYTQPVWALPSEILGLQNIYLNSSLAFAGRASSRSIMDFLMVLISSVFILFMIVSYVRKNTRPANALFIGSIIMVALAGVSIAIKSPHNNYTYMKMYLFHLPFLFLIFWAALCVFLRKFNQAYIAVASWFVVVLIVLGGITYVVEYKDQSVKIASKRFSLHKSIMDSGLDLNKVIIYPYLLHGHAPDIMYPAILPAPWFLNSWSQVSYYFVRNFKDYKVYFFVEKNKNHRFLETTTSIKFENDWCYIVDSNKTIGDAIVSNPETDGDQLTKTNASGVTLDQNVFKDLILLVPLDIDMEKVKYNLTNKLPFDFDPQLYLEFNPDLQKFWKVKGIKESGHELMKHAELHYRAFGKKEGRPYK